MSPSERAALEYLAEHGPAPLSAIGYRIREAVLQTGERKRNPSPQGMALFAGRFVRSLFQAQLVTPCARGWYIMQAGREWLAENSTPASGAGGQQ